MTSVVNHHERRLVAPPARVGVLIDGLGGDDDRLWPAEVWPAQRLDRPLALGAAGGHGAIRYRVEGYEPGRWIRYRFTSPSGFHGFHEFALAGPPDGPSILRHTLVMRTAGAARITWPLIFRHLHDALIEDVFDRAEAATAPVPAPASAWSLAPRWNRRVRLLRRLAGAVVRSRRGGGGGRAGRWRGRPPPGRCPR